LSDNAGLPTTKPRDSALRAVTKEVVGIHVLLTRSLFGGDILRRLIRRVSLNCGSIDTPARLFKEIDFIALTEYLAFRGVTH